MIVEIYSREDCKLCDDALQLLERLKKEFRFDIREIGLTEDHPKFKDFFMAIPVVVINGVQTFAGEIKEEELRAVLTPHRPKSKSFYIAKTLEALGFLTVAVGLMYGLVGDMWRDLYFFLAGIVVFAIGRVLEKRVTKRREEAFPSEFLLK